MNHNPAEPPSGGASDGGVDPDVTIPDDIRELDRDIEAWRREERWQRRRQRIERVLPTKKWRRRGVSAPALVMILVAVALLGATISILTPRQTRLPARPVQLALAAPTASPGTPHGLLPDIELTANDNQLVDARGLRPGVVALVTPDCHCQAAFDQLAHIVSANALSVYVVGTPGQAGEISQLMGNAGAYDVRAYTDASGILATTYRPSGLTVIPIHADGVTEPIIRDYDGGSKVRPVLVNLKQPGPA